MDGAMTVASRESGLPVRVRPPGVRMYLELEAELDAVAAAPDPVAALRSLADRIDRYALDEFPRPSDVSPSELAAWVRDWLGGVRDAAAPLPSGGGSPSPEPT